MKRSTKSILVIIVIIVVLAVLIPIAIHSMFVPESEQALLASRWSAGDLLSYCGAILSALATILAIILTINFTIGNQKKERKLAIKPHLHSEYRPIYDFTELSEKSIFVTIGDKYEYSAQMPYSMRKVRDEKEPFGKATEMWRFRTHNHVILFELTNVGAGNALNAEITINERPFNTPIALPLNTTIQFVFLLKDEILVEDKKELKIVITYSDVASIARYKQHEIIEIFRDTTDECLNSRQDIKWLLSNPIEIKK